MIFFVVNMIGQNLPLLLNQNDFLDKKGVIRS